MPYTRDEAQTFTRKATTDASRRQWEHVVQYYLGKGWNERAAIRAANAAVGRKSAAKSITGGQS